jgi:ribA/ribD-fused uncharacterized protein
MGGGLLERITNTHVYFWKSKLSNWYHCPFKYKGRLFQNSEQAFMWEKAIFFSDNDIADDILNTPDPKEAQALGRKVKNFDREKWLYQGLSVMIDVNFERFSQNKEQCELLLSTGNKTLVEASPDNIWGVGIHWKDDLVLDDKNWKGKNLLGKSLMCVRSRLRAMKLMKLI